MSVPSDPRVQLLKTAFVVYNHANLEKAKSFLLDFGLEVAFERPGEEIFFKGYGTEPYVYVARKAETSSFGGAAYVVDSPEELQKAQKIPGASALVQLEGQVGGGQQVTLTDPFGHQVHLIWGWQERPKQPMGLEKLVINYEDEKPRKGRFQRFKNGPAPCIAGAIMELHIQMVNMKQFMIVSDVVYKGDDPITCFFHIDRGLEYADHHAFFFKKAKPTEDLNVAHAAFEVHDFDIQQLGHNYLTSKGHKICWGVGRHVLGSQVFDYWFDPSNFVVEHYADGDLVNCETPIAHVQAGPEALSVWGPPLPQVF